MIHRRRKNFGRQRRGIATLWLILLMPVLLVLMCLAVDVGQLWVGRSSLENALEIAALATAKEWGDLGAGAQKIPAANRTGIAFAAANTVCGQSVSLSADNFIYGTVEFRPGGNVFHMGKCDRRGPRTSPCVWTAARQRISSLCGGFGPYTLSARTAACYDRRSRRVRLIRVDEFRRDGSVVPPPQIPDVRDW